MRVYKFSKSSSVTIIALLMISVFSGMMAVQPLVEVYAQTNGLVSWWPGEGDAKDIMGLNHGTLQGGTSFETGIVGQSFSFDGIDDFVMIPDSSTLNFSTRDFTIDLWINYRTLNGEQIIVEKWIQKFPEPSYGWTLTKLNTYNPIIRLALLGEHENVNFFDVDPPYLTINKWIYIALTRENHKFTLYWNGDPIFNTFQEIDLDSTSSLKFGHRGNPIDTPGSEDRSGFYLNGQIDEVRVFNRALSASEIMTYWRKIQTINKDEKPEDVESVRNFMMEIYSKKIQDHVLILFTILGGWYSFITFLYDPILKYRNFFLLVFVRF